MTRFDSDQFLHQIDAGEIATCLRHAWQSRWHPLVIMAQFVEHSPITRFVHLFKVNDVWYR